MKNVDLVRPVDLRGLLDEQKAPRVSIYMPTHKKSDQKKQDPLRLKNLLKQAEKQLVEAGTRSSAARELLEPLAGLVQDYSFWKYQSEGLAVFVSPGKLSYYHLPRAFDELVVTGQHFHFKPLLPLLSRDGLFYILMLSQHAVRLFQATRFAIGEISLEGLIPDRPQHMKLHHDLERRFESHTKNAGYARPVSRHLPYFFGQGTHCDCSKEDISQFFQKIDRAVEGMIREDHHPMIPVGDEYIVDLYRKVNHYPYMVPQEITGNQEVTDERQLQRLAFPLIEPEFRRSREQTEQTYLDLTGTLRIDNSIRRILPASYEGLVQAIFVPIGQRVWGRFNGKKDTMEVHDREAPDDQDLLDLSALYTLLHKGTVYAVAPDTMPGSGIVNAIYRY